jgi:hypothetical protein
MGRTFMGLNKRLIKFGRVGEVRFREGWVLLNRDAGGGGGTSMAGAGTVYLSLCPVAVPRSILLFYMRKVS